MRKKSVRLAAIIAGCLVVATAGVSVLNQFNYSGTHTSNVPSAVKNLSTVAAVPNYRLSGGKMAKAATPVWQTPLRNDGIPAKARWDFTSRANIFNLSLIPTYDGSNQETHPKLLYFPSGWNGYRYWMSVTPYPATDARFENPCIVVSNDLKKWVVPKGLKNPVTGVPKDVKYGGHYSDSQLVMNGGVMELWYRANIGVKKSRMPDYRSDYYYRITSADGIHWSKPQMMQSSKDSILSLAVIRQQNRYQFWYTDRSHRLMYGESGNGTHWTNSCKCEIPLPKGYVPWHQDVVYCNNRYYLLQTALHTPYSFALFLSESDDGVHFTKGTPFYSSDNPTILHKTWLYRSTFVPVENGMFQMVISYRLPGNKWFMTQCSMSQKAWDEACLTNREVILKQPVVRTPTPLSRVSYGVSSRVSSGASSNVSSRVSSKVSSRASHATSSASSRASSRASGASRVSSGTSSRASSNTSSSSSSRTSSEPAKMANVSDHAV